MFPATRPNLPSAVASEDKEKNREILLTDVFLWLLQEQSCRLRQFQTLFPQSTKRPAVETASLSAAQ
jgi:hypothetical protein